MTGWMTSLPTESVRSADKNLPFSLMDLRLERLYDLRPSWHLNSVKKRLPNNSSIFSAAAPGSQLLFLSDCLSCLRNLQNRNLSHSLNAETLCRVLGLISDGTSVVSMWAPSHILDWQETRRRLVLQKLPYSCSSV